MTSLIFVHGTGVRAAGYEQALGLVRKAMKGPDINIHEALWGDELGVRLHGNGSTIPPDEHTLAVAGAAAEDEIVALWSMLFEDPLYELRLISSQPARGGSAAFVPGRQTPAAALQEAMLALTQPRTPSHQIRAALAAANLATDALEKAAQAVAQSSAYKAMLPFLREPLSPIRSALARAIVARLVLDQAVDNPAAPYGQSDLALPSLDGSVRDSLVTAISEEMGAAELGVGTWLFGHLGGLAERWGTNHVLRNRRTLSHTIYPGVGDILRYQVRGEVVRNYIRRRIEAVEAPVLLLAHSLGGIICTDLLIAQDLSERVRLLVTVGSQAPFFYELDVLSSLRWGEQLPTHFPRWLNIFDRRDFLSYVGGPVFPGRISDISIDSRQPFPHSHSAYWTNERTWDLIRAEWAAANPRYRTKDAHG